MAIVVKWRQDGEYVSGIHVGYGVSGIEWTERQSEARRFANQREFREWTARAGLLPRNQAPGWWERIAYVRLVPRKRNGNAKP